MSEPKNIRKFDHPEDDLSRLATQMTDLLPEGCRAIIMLHDADDNGMLHLRRYSSEGEAVEDILVHLKVIFQANGQDLVVVPVHRPPN